VVVIRTMMEAVRTSETSVNFKVTTRRYIPEDSKLHFALSSQNYLKVRNIKDSLAKYVCTNPALRNSIIIIIIIIIIIFTLAPVSYGTMLRQPKIM
jgi:hypothetical protein